MTDNIVTIQNRLTTAHIVTVSARIALGLAYNDFQIRASATAWNVLESAMLKYQESQSTERELDQELYSQLQLDQLNAK